MEPNKLLTILHEVGGILEGHFLLTSGRHSNMYIEKFRILENPHVLDKVSRAMAEIVKDKNVELVLGAAIGGILISGGVGRYLGATHIFSERVNGNMELRRGFSITMGQKVVIVEDVITTGGSVLELIQLTEGCQAEIVQVINLVDRSPDGIDFGVPTTALLNLPNESWEPFDCPLCRQDVPLAQRGRTGKKLETK